MLRVCIASIQNVERSLLLLVVSASDIPLRTIKFFTVLFSSAYWSMLQAVANKHSLVRRRLCDLHCMVVGNCFCHVVVCTSSNRSIASSAWPTVTYSLLGFVVCIFGQGYRMVKKNYDDMLSSFHLIPERYGRTDGQTDRFAISISRISILRC